MGARMLPRQQRSGRHDDPDPDPYAHLGNGAGPVRDLTAVWERLTPIGEADDEARGSSGLVRA